MRYRKRGRPKSSKPAVDLGTRELQEKRKSFSTQEPLDHMYHTNIIDEKQYWCGNHFRWLYTTRYGVPNIRAASGVMVDNPSTIIKNTGHQEALEQQYQKAAIALKSKKLLNPLLNTVVYSQCAENGLHNSQQFQLVIPSLDVLVDLWC